MALLKGIDVSHYQQGIDLKKIQADFVIVKASEGIGYEDPSCRQFAKETVEAKKKLGLYHFARPGKQNTAEKEAEWFLSIFHPYIGKAIPILDWEAEEIENVTWAKEWLDHVYEKSGVRPWIYMSESVVNSYDWKEVAKHYPLWMALYRNDRIAFNYDMSDAGTLVHVNNWHSIACWQWTSHGRLVGWRGDLDCDQFYGDRKRWDEYERKQNHEIKSQQYIIVKKGDTLSALANRYQTSIENLVRWNHIKDPDHILVGEKLRVR